jgi:WD40 repeat protein
VYASTIDAHLLFMDCSCILVLYRTITTLKAFATKYRRQVSALSPDHGTIAVFGVTRKRAGSRMVRAIMLSIYDITGSDYTLAFTTRIGDANTNHTEDPASASFALAWSNTGHNVVVAAGWHVEIVNIKTGRHTTPMAAHLNTQSTGGRPVRVQFVDQFAAAMSVLVSCGARYCISNTASECTVNTSSLCGISRISPKGNLIVGQYQSTDASPLRGMQVLDAVNLAHVDMPLARPIATAPLAVCTVVALEWSPNQDELAVLFDDGTLRVYTANTLEQLACVVLPSYGISAFTWRGNNTICVALQNIHGQTVVATLRRSMSNAMRRMLLLGNHHTNSVCVLSRLPTELLHWIMAHVDERRQ